MSGKILQVFNFLDIHSNDSLNILHNAGEIRFSKTLLLFPKKIYFEGNGQFWNKFGPFWAGKLHILLTLEPFQKFFKNFA